MNAVGRNDLSTCFIHCFPDGLLGLFDSSCFTSFSQVLVAGFSIACPVRFLEVDVDSLRPINREQFGVIIIIIIIMVIFKCYFSGELIALL